MVERMIYGIVRVRYALPPTNWLWIDAKVLLEPMQLPLRSHNSTHVRGERIGCGSIDHKLPLPLPPPLQAISVQPQLDRRAGERVQNYI